MTRLPIMIIYFITWGTVYCAFGQNSEYQHTRKILEEFQKTLPYHLAYSEEILETPFEGSFIDFSNNWKEILDTLENYLQVKYRIVGDQLILFPKKKYIIRGYVFDKETGESLPGAHVLNNQNLIGTVSDQAGHFQLYLPEGINEISVSYLGYQHHRTQLNIQEPTEINIYLQTTVDLPQVIVTGEHYQTTSINPSGSQNLPVSEMEKFPSLGSKMDVARFLQLTPGILTGGDGLGGIHVRGGNADQNLILLEDIPVFNPFHLFGISSIFNGDVLQEVKFSKCYFSPALDGRLSSAMQISIRDGHRSSRSLKASTGMLSSHLMVETPLFKKRGTFMIAGQRSHVGDLLKNYTSRVRSGADNEGYFKPLFQDIYSKALLTLGKHDRLIFNFYTGSDKHLDINRYPFEVNIDTSLHDQYQDEYEWGNLAGGIKWFHQYREKYFLRLNIYHSRYFYQSRNAYVEQINVRGTPENGTSELTEFRSSIRESGAGINLSFPVGFIHQLKTGLRAIHQDYIPGIIAYGEDAASAPLFTIGSPLPALDKSLFDQLSFSSDQFHLYFEDEWNPSDEWNFNYGINSTLFQSGDQTFYSLQPRINVSLKKGKHYFGFSLNKLYQPQHSITANDNGLPSDLWVPASGTWQPQKSWSSDLGWTYIISDATRISSNFYYKKMTGLLSFRDNPGYLNYGPLDNVDASLWESDLISGEGESWGIENSLKAKWNRFNLRVSYTFSKSSRHFPGKFLDLIVPYEFESPHSGAFMGSWDINPRWNIGMTWQITSGNRYSLIPGNYELYDNFDYFLEEFTVPEGDLELLLMPVYHRMDISTGYTFSPSPKVTHTFKLSIINTYDRRNIIFPRIYRDEISEIRYYQGLPLVPSISYHLSLH